jgi:hypothetical protein
MYRLQKLPDVVAGFFCKPTCSSAKARDFTWAHLSHDPHRMSAQFAMRLQQIHPQRCPHHLLLHFGCAHVSGSGQSKLPLHRAKRLLHFEAYGSDSLVDLPLPAL